MGGGWLGGGWQGGGGREVDGREVDGREVDGRVAAEARECTRCGPTGRWLPRTFRFQPRQTATPILSFRLLPGTAICSRSPSCRISSRLRLEEIRGRYGSRISSPLWSRSPTL